MYPNPRPEDHLVLKFIKSPLAAVLALSVVLALVVVIAMSCEPEAEATLAPIPTPDPLTLAQDWVDDNLGTFAAELIDLVLVSDLGFGALDVQVKNLIRADVTEQLSVGLNASFSLDAANWRVVLVVLTGVVTIVTEPTEALGGVVKVHAIEGTIEVEQPYTATLQEDETFVWERVPEGLSISIDLSAAQ